MRRSTDIGRVRLSLAVLLSAKLTEKLGEPVGVDPSDIWGQQGYYRGPKSGCACWGVRSRPTHTYPFGVCVVSWGTMTKDVRGLRARELELHWNERGDYWEVM